ncbi:serine hydrolase domain-containing protein [Brachybacterium hainanense]|uniref:Serine hydrolase domain-containing protein n=1 Tax=Brachybacterium hainanense TaxID=1541174 RepID=A0ABV6RG13_9MICO
MDSTEEHGAQQSAADQDGAALAIDLPFACAIGVTGPEATLATRGDVRRAHPLASVSKPITALGALVAVDRGVLDLDEPAGPAGSTIRHLLAHAAGYAFDARQELARPGERRMYSNAGFEVLGEQLELATGYEIGEWLETTVCDPLGLADLEVEGSPAAGFHGSITDLLALGRELLRPTLIGSELAREARTVQFPGLPGLLPGYGRQSPNDWGLGLEIRGAKSPHWTGSLSSPETVGHFGQSGSFLWVDPQAQLAAAFLGEKPFSPVHVAAWPGLTDAILRAFGPQPGPPGS